MRCSCPSSATGSMVASALDILFQAAQHHRPVLLRVLPLLLGRVVVLRKGHERLIPMTLQLDGHGVIVLGDVWLACERAEMRVRQAAVLLGAKDLAFVLIGFALPFPAPGDGPARPPVRL